MKEVENLTLKPLSEFQQTDTLYIQKLKNGYAISYLCSFECIKRGIVHGKIISATPDWVRPDVGSIITARPDKCSLWGILKGERHPRCFWFSDTCNKVKGTV